MSSPLAPIVRAAIEAAWRGSTLDADTVLDMAERDGLIGVLVLTDLDAADYPDYEVGSSIYRWTALGRELLGVK